jgi:hypothetical protein
MTQVLTDAIATVDAERPTTLGISPPAAAAERLFDAWWSRFDTN